MGLTKLGLSSVLFFSFLLATPSSMADQSKTLKVRVSTPHGQYLLEPGKSITVEITVTDSSGTGVEHMSLQLASNVGRFHKFHEKGKGRYVAKWSMPQKRYPQVAILAAKVPGAPPGFRIIRLRSATKLPTRTSKPRVSVTLKIGERKYGPVKSDDKGNVVIPVELGPGETEAMATAVDEFGNIRTKRVNIPQPKYRMLVGFAERTALETDGVSSSKIYLISALPSGHPNSSLKIVAYREGGKLSSSKRISDGLYLLSYTAPTGRKKKKRISLTLADKSNARKSRVKFLFSLNPGSPAKLSLSFNPEKLTANGRASSNVMIMVKDRGGNLIGGYLPKLHCDTGSVGQVLETGDGSYQSMFTPPPGATGKISCHATLELKSRQSIKTESQIELLPPVPASMKLDLSSRSLPMDGVSRSILNIEITDSDGVALDGVAIRLRAGKGAIDSVTSDGNGKYHAIYTAPRGQENTKVRIVATAGQGDKTIKKDIILELEGMAPPLPPSPWITLGPSGAFMTNFALLMSGGFSVDLGVKVPGLAGYLYLDLESGYRYGTNESESTDGENVKTAVGFSPLHLTLVLKPLAHSSVTPLLGLGGGVEFVQWSISTSDSYTERQHKVLPGALAMLGCEIRMGPGALVLFVRYLYSFLRDEAPLGTNHAKSASRIKGSVGGLDVSLGYQLHF